MKYFAFVFLLFSIIACQSQSETATNNHSETVMNNQNEYLIKIVNDDDATEKVGYINEKGDTIIPFGKYAYLFTDTITDLGIVINSDGVCIGIDKNDTELFEVYWFDNGPDYLEDGLFRIKKDGKIGYANERGEIVIKPQFECANSFKNGKAKVSKSCNLIPDGENTITESNNWFFIDKTGNTIAD